MVELEVAVDGGKDSLSMAASAGALLLRPLSILQPILRLGEHASAAAQAGAPRLLRGHAAAFIGQMPLAGSPMLFRDSLTPWHALLPLAGSETVKAPGNLVVSAYVTCPDITQVRRGNGHRNWHV